MFGQAIAGGLPFPPLWWWKRPLFFYKYPQAPLLFRDYANYLHSQIRVLSAIRGNSTRKSKTVNMHCD